MLWWKTYTCTCTLTPTNVHSHGQTKTDILYALRQVLIIIGMAKLSLVGGAFLGRIFLRTCVAAEYLIIFPHVFVSVEAAVPS